MRSSQLLFAILPLAAACSSTQSAPSISDPDLRDPKAEFDVLRSLAGEWVACGVGDTKTELFDVRFLVLDGGATVEAVMLGGVPNDAVLTYRLDNDRITMIQRPSGGESLSMPCEPIHVPVIETWRIGGSWESESASIKRTGPDREVRLTPDPSIHEFEFKPTESAHVDWPKKGRLAEAQVHYWPEGGINLAWFCGDTIFQYKLTRKHPEGVVHHADSVEAPHPSWQDKKAYFDLRSDPVAKDEAH